MNNVNLTGRLTRDPELKFLTGNGTAVCNFTIAVDKNLSKEKKQQMEAQGKPTADFIRIIVWGKRAETCANYLKKGLLCGVSGAINTSTYKSQSGETRYSTDINASNVEFLEWADKSEKKDDFISLDEDTGFAGIDLESDIPF